MSIDAPETERVDRARISCDGGGGALGHPLVWLTVDPVSGLVECPYCDKRFILKDGPADESD
ncbi:MAG: zinc-finger domain-containing protein [Pseudomonadota bacterium]